MLLTGSLEIVDTVCGNKKIPAIVDEIMEIGLMENKNGGYGILKIIYASLYYRVKKGKVDFV